MGRLNGDKYNTSSGTTIHVAGAVNQRRQTGIAKKLLAAPTRLKCVQMRLDNHMPRSPPPRPPQLTLGGSLSGLSGRRPLVKIICMKNNMESVSDSTFEVRRRGKTYYRRISRFPERSRSVETAPLHPSRPKPLREFAVMLEPEKPRERGCRRPKVTPRATVRSAPHRNAGLSGRWQRSFGACALRSRPCSRSCAGRLLGGS